jgi:hypothetical protein
MESVADVADREAASKNPGYYRTKVSGPGGLAHRGQNGILWVSTFSYQFSAVSFMN